MAPDSQLSAQPDPTPATPAGAGSYRLAHLSDLHLAPLPRAALWQLASKRITGFLSWQVGRRHIHVSKALEAVCADVRRGGFDHIAVTGDIANISLPAEFERGAQFLATLGDPQHVTVVPGNHDTYVRVDPSRGLRKWNAYMTGDAQESDNTAGEFPFLRRRGPLGIVGLNTGVPEAWFYATGELGQAQIDKAEAMLETLRQEGRFRLVLIHHPPQPGGARWRKRLIDAPQFQAMIGRVGAELIVHGHNHRSLLGRIKGPDGTVPVLGVASASSDFTSHYGPGGYNAISISRGERDWRVEVEIRQLTGDYAGCKPVNVFRLNLPQSQAIEAA